MYFESPKTLEELKNQFRKLALKFHPDRNMDDIEASTQAMKDINAEYEKLFDLLEKEKPPRCVICKREAIPLKFRFSSFGTDPVAYERDSSRWG